MQIYFRVRLSLLLILLAIFFNGVEASAQAEKKRENEFTPQNPRYELKLNLNEFSMLNSAVVNGLNKYGGSAEFDVNMAKEGSEVVWTLTSQNKQLIEVWGYYIAEKSTDLIKLVNIDSLDANSKIALKTIKSLSEKIDNAQRNPFWELVNLSGVVVEDKGTWFIAGKLGKYRITGSQLANLQKTNGKAIVAQGFIKVKDQIEVIKFLEKKDNTLELFVMSLCPFGQKAELSLTTFWQNYSGKSKPSLEIHYIFYNKKEDEKEIFTSLHGEKEIKENLAQIVIRDRHPKFFFDYLRRRARNNDISWENLAKDIGLKDKDIESIAQTIKIEREKLIQKEYNYATEIYGIYDGSPTYVWQSERVTDIYQLEAFKGLGDASIEACSQ